MTPLTALHGAEPRLAPIERPGSLWLWIFNFVTRRMLGKVMMPAKVIYPRMPRLLVPQTLLVSLAQYGLSLPSLLVHLVQARVSMHNGCTFCMDLHRAAALREGHAHAKLAAVLGPSFESSAAAWSPLERAALAFADEATLRGRPSDATFAALRALLDEREVVELTWLCAFTTYLNRLAVPLDIGSDGFCALLEAS